MNTPTTTDTPQIGTLAPMIRIGTSGGDNARRQMAPRWWSDPIDSVNAAVERCFAWCRANHIPTTFLCYHPFGVTSGTYQFDQYPLLAAIDPVVAEALAVTLRYGAMECELPAPFYLGAISSYRWRTRADLARCLNPIMSAGRTSLAIDALNGWGDFPMNRRCLAGMQLAFAEVIGEGGMGENDRWMTDPNPIDLLDRVPIMHTADVHESIYSRRPELYDALRPGDWIMVSNVPTSLRGADPADKTAWKRRQAAMWLRRGVNVTIEPGEIEGITLKELLETSPTREPG